MANIVQHNPVFGNIGRFDPFHEDEWFKGFLMRPFFREMEGVPQIKMDITENDKAYTVHAEIPGLRKEDIKVQVDGNRVSISAGTSQEKQEKKGDKVICRERYQGASYRSFTLDSSVDEGGARAKYDNGVLELTLPKKNGVSAKQLEIK